MPRKYATTVTFNANPEAVLACVMDVFTRDFRIRPERGPRGVTARTGWSFTSWGENITVLVESAGPQGTILNVRSELIWPLTWVDWGKNRRNVEKLISQVGPRLAPGGPGAYGPPGASGPPGAYGQGGPFAAR